MDKEQNVPDTQHRCVIVDSAFAVIPDAERLDIGSNKIVAVFKHKHQAEKWAKSMWREFYIIKEIQSEHFKKQ